MNQKPNIRPVHFEEKIKSLNPEDLSKLFIDLRTDSNLSAFSFAKEHKSEFKEAFDHFLKDSNNKEIYTDFKKIVGHWNDLFSNQKDQIDKSANPLQIASNISRLAESSFEQTRAELGLIPIKERTEKALSNFNQSIENTDNINLFTGNPATLSPSGKAFKQLVAAFDSISDGSFDHDIGKLGRKSQNLESPEYLMGEVLKDFIQKGKISHKSLKVLLSGRTQHEKLDITDTLKAGEMRIDLIRNEPKLSIGTSNFRQDISDFVDSKIKLLIGGEISQGKAFDAKLLKISLDYNYKRTSNYIKAEIDRADENGLNTKAAKQLYLRAINSEIQKKETKLSPEPGKTILSNSLQIISDKIKVISDKLSFFKPSKGRTGKTTVKV